MRNTIASLILLAAPLPCRAESDERAEKALQRLTNVESRVEERLRAADELAELRATAPLLDAWVADREHFRPMAPVCFHAIGIGGLQPGLTAMSAEEPARRAAGAVLLGSIGPNARLGVRKLLMGLSDDSELVRLESTRALGNIGASASDAISGLIALAMRDPKLTLDALQAMTRITLDFQLRELRTPLAKPVARLVDLGQGWLRVKQAPDGTWADPMTDAIVLLAFLQGGIEDVNRVAVERALRRVVVLNFETKAPHPLVVSLMYMAWRETRDPLYLIAGNRMVDRLTVTSVDGARTSNLHALALRQAQWAGVAIETAAWEAIPETSPVLLRRVLLPGIPDEKAEQAEAGRMIAKPLKWEREDARWEPRYLVREAWAISLAGGEPRKVYRDNFFAAVFPNILPAASGEPPTVGHWEPPGGVDANAAATTAAIVSVLRMYDGQYPPRRLPMPKVAIHKAAVHALKGALTHPDEHARAYAKAMLTLWASS